MAEEAKENKYDWEGLKLKFLVSDTPTVAEFIRRELGVERDNDGNISRHTRGWAEDKADRKREIAAEAERQLLERYKISLEDILASKKVLFELDREFLRVAGKMAFKQKEITEEERAFFKAYWQRSKDIWTRLQIELGQPINIEKLGAMKEGEIGKLIVEIIENKENAKIPNQGDNSVPEERGGIQEPDSQGGDK